MKNMHAGKLRQSVTIQSRTNDDQDSVGQPQDPWRGVVTVRAAIEPLNGREYFSAQQVVSDVTTRITIRYRPGITTANRVVAHFGNDDVNYDILDVIDTEMQHREIQLMCKTGLIDVNG